MQALTDTDGWTDLGTFLGHHGKVLFYHGVSDPWFSALDTLDYWQRAGQTNGTAWGQSSRFYMVPGMAHCRGGDAFDRFDLLDAVVAWVERHKAPDAIVAHRAQGGRPGRYALAGLCPLQRRRSCRGGQLFLRRRG
jgi:feruloyl esterase